MSGYAILENIIEINLILLVKFLLNFSSFGAKLAEISWDLVQKIWLRSRSYLILLIGGILWSFKISYLPPRRGRSNTCTFYQLDLLILFETKPFSDFQGEGDKFIFNKNKKNWLEARWWTNIRNFMIKWNEILVRFVEFINVSISMVLPLKFVPHILHSYLLGKMTHVSLIGNSQGNLWLRECQTGFVNFPS